MAGIGIVLLVGAASALLVWQPRHGPTVLSLSSAHGVDLGDLPALALLALAVASAHAWVRGSDAEPRRPGRWAGPASAVALGVLLLVAFLHDPRPGSLLPAGGGTFAGTTLHTDGQRADPVDQWSHLALTYDGSTLRLYVNGEQVSSRAVSGTIRRTSHPLWIGGNHPYGEYFRGLIDEVRVYDRALDPDEVRAEMTTPIADGGASPASGLVGAYAFDAGSGILAADASGNGNAGAIAGPTWTTRGRFGDALRFDGAGGVVRVPASASLDLSGAMTLSAWVRPSEPQGGWRTIVARQTDAYFLTAGNGNLGPSALDEARVVMLVCAAAWFCVALAGGRLRWNHGSRGSWWAPVGLFLAGSILDATVAPSGTVTGPTLVAIWLAATASRRVDAACMYVVAAVLAGVSVVALAGAGDLEITRDGGGFARSAALGLVLVTAGLLAARAGSGEAPRPR